MFAQSEKTKMGTALALCFVVLTLTACSRGAKPAGPPIANGTWASSDGVYTATFANGSFRATANDTGETLSQGRYIVKTKDQLRIEWQGNVSRAENSAECTKPNPEEMNCLDQNGKSFTLRRTSQTV